MLSKNELALLKAIFCKELHDAILKKDLSRVNEIIQNRYPGQYYEDTEVDIDYLYTEHKRQLAEDDFKWAY